jgi:hypothetical protein
MHIQKIIGKELEKQFIVSSAVEFEKLFHELTFLFDIVRARCL